MEPKPLKPFPLAVKTYPVTLEFLRFVRDENAKSNAHWKGFERGEVRYLGDGPKEK